MIDKQVPYSWQGEFGNVFYGDRVVVTGASGFIGSHLCDALASLGALVYGLDVTGHTLPNVHRTSTTDLRDTAATQQAISEIKPDLIYHLAGLVTASQEPNLIIPMLQNNLVGTVNLLFAALNSECQRVVVVGSSEEISMACTDGIPTSPYAAAKAASTMYSKMFFRLYKLPTVVVRPFMTFGPRQNRMKLVPYTILSLLRNESPKLSSGQRITDLVYVVDLIRGFLKAGIQPSIDGKVIELGTGNGIRLGDLADLLVKLTGSTASPLLGEGPERLEEYPQIANLEQTRLMINWAPLWSLEEGLIETIDWYRANALDPMDADHLCEKPGLV